MTKECLLMSYDGWRIYAYRRTISKSNLPIIINELKTWFNNHEWYLSENTHRTVIFYEPTKQEIKVTIQEVQYASERNEDVETFHIVFESTFFGLRNYEEKLHQEVLEKTMQKIRWNKLGGFLEDGVFKPKPKYKILRMK